MVRSGLPCSPPIRRISFNGRLLTVRPPSGRAGASLLIVNSFESWLTRHGGEELIRRCFGLGLGNFPGGKGHVGQVEAEIRQWTIVHSIKIGRLHGSAGRWALGIDSRNQGYGCDKRRRSPA